MRFRVLGPVEIESDAGRVHSLARRQERCLPAILLLEAGRVLSVDRLCQVLWDDSPPVRARRAVHAHVARIRAALSTVRADSGDPAGGHCRRALALLEKLGHRHSPLEILHDLDHPVAHEVNAKLSDL